MNVITHPNPAIITQGFGGLPGAQYDAQLAREALSTARRALATTRRNAGPDYTFWRLVNLGRVKRCRAAVRRYEAEVREIMTARAVVSVPMRMAAE